MPKELWVGRLSLRKNEFFLVLWEKESKHSNESIPLSRRLINNSKHAVNWATNEMTSVGKLEGKRIS